ncbi:MFS transporter [Corynebacterium endometrii]|uniref:Tetracycline resistance protein, class C n=1 Tax=Corynebacterium endometrii TaxID=2488819 RepID=A0A4P7QHI2_9CORY|nr:MFS transporter [Corynebacterium endometrii]QCB28197.1 Tetracycline resistance protein, class C [Corynebacterium endometrii]
MNSTNAAPATLSQQPPRIPREIWIMVTAGFIIAIGYGLIAPLLPQFVRSFDVSMTAAGIVVSVFSASRLIFAPGSGALVDKVGSRKVYLTGLMTVAVTTGMVAIAQEYWHILALRAVSGIGSTMFTVSAMGLIVKLSPPTIRGKCSAVYGTSFLLGNVFGPLVGAALSFLGFRWPFFIYGVAVALAALVVWLMMPKIDPALAKKSSLPPMRIDEAWRDTAFRAALTSNFSQGYINMGVRVSVLPLFAAAVFHNGAAASGFALAAFAGGNALVMQFSGKLADRIGRKPMIITGLVLTSIFMGTLGFAENVIPLIIMSILAGGASGMIAPAQQAALADVIGNSRSGGQVLSTFQMAGDFGQILGPILIGLLADIYGFKIAFAACGFIGLVGAIAWAFSRETLEDRTTTITSRLRPLAWCICSPR